MPTTIEFVNEGMADADTLKLEHRSHMDCGSVFWQFREGKDGAWYSVARIRRDGNRETSFAPLPNHWPIAVGPRGYPFELA